MRLTRSPPDYNYATFDPFLLRLCQRVIVEDVLITNQLIKIQPLENTGKKTDITARGWSILLAKHILPPFQM